MSRHRHPPHGRRASQSAALALGTLGTVLLCGCSSQTTFPSQTQSMSVSILKVTYTVTSGTQTKTITRPGDKLPTIKDSPLPLPTAHTPVEIDTEIKALKADGTVDTTFNGYVRVSVEPGAVVDVQGADGAGAEGRNALLKNGVAKDEKVFVEQARGPTRLWVEDIGYKPADPFKPPECSDGIDNDGDGLIDYPQDPGCAFANDDSETGGTFAAGVSHSIYFQKPRLADVQGLSAATPYPEQAVNILTDPPAEDIVTAVASDGFFTTDITDKRGYNHMYAYTFSTPGGLRVCDRLTDLSGTASEFFGFTELNFPSYDVHEWRFPTKTSKGDGACRVPEPWVIDKTNLVDPVQMESHESGLVRVQNVTVANELGPKLATNGHFAVGQSNCDLNGDGKVDFTAGSPEAACAQACDADPQCSEWTEYSSRGDYRVNLANGGGSIQVNTSALSGFDPTALHGQTLASVTGMLREFSGGTLNWTINARCRDDLVCTESNSFCKKGPQKPVSSSTACVEPRTTYDPNEATN